jgi:hypothetical protein
MSVRTQVCTRPKSEPFKLNIYIYTLSGAHWVAHRLSTYYHCHLHEGSLSVQCTKKIVPCTYMYEECMRASTGPLDAQLRTKS